MGYVIWALLTPDVEREFIAGKPRPLADWEYSDGTNAWVLDMAVAPGSLRYVLEDLRDVVFEGRATDLLPYQGRAPPVQARVSRQDGSSFIAAGPPEGCSMSALFLPNSAWVPVTTQRLRA